MESLRVRSFGGDRFTIDIRGFGVEVDQPLDIGGTDIAPTPTELLVASLAACVAFYAGRYLRRHEFAEHHLGVDCRFEMSEDSPHRVAVVEMDLIVPASLNDKQREVLLKVVDGCAVHNTLRQPPEVRISLSQRSVGTTPSEAAALTASPIPIRVQ